MGSGTELDIIARVDGALGHLTLNRPRAINALTLAMIRAIDRTLTAWETDSRVTVVLLDGAGERGFCAGGDIRALYDAAQTGDPMPRVFFREEYQLDARIASYPKPVVTVMDGIVMGGGVGLAGHASHRIATERLAMAMPEVSIGFAPDVGGTYLLSRAPGELGTHLALTGDRIGAQDAMLCGFADSAIAGAALEPFIVQLRAGNVAAALAGPTTSANPLPPGRLAAAREWIDWAYVGDSVEEVLARLASRLEPEALAAIESIQRQSPTSLKIALRSLREARRLPTLEACLDQEYRVSCALMDTPDFTEGVRAMVVDKDGSPRWRPPTLAEIENSDIERHFATLGADELGLAA